MNIIDEHFESSILVRYSSLWSSKIKIPCLKKKTFYKHHNFYSFHSQDTTVPVITGLSDISVNTPTDQATATVSWTPPTVDPGETLTSTHNAGDSFDIGETTVTYTATDDNFNSVTASFTVTVSGN